VAAEPKRRVQVVNVAHVAAASTEAGLSPLVLGLLAVAIVCLAGGAVPATRIGTAGAATALAARKLEVTAAGAAALSLAVIAMLFGWA
jgi:hypothetical protein